LLLKAFTPFSLEWKLSPNHLMGNDHERHLNIVTVYGVIDNVLKAIGHVENSQAVISD